MRPYLKRALIFGLAVAAIVLLFFYFRRPVKISTTIKGEPVQTVEKLSLTSPTLENDDNIPGFNTCDGVNFNPGLRVAGVSPEVKSFVLILEDLDAPGGVFSHWLVWNIRPDALKFPENVVPAGGVVGTNDFGKQQYSGPCPPRGDKAHKYQFVVFALDSKLELAAASGRTALDEAMKGHILDRAFMTLFYRR